MAQRPDPNQHLWGGMSTGVTISATLLSGILVWGGVGYLVDRVAGTGKAFTAMGMLLGAGVAIYLVYLRYGKGDAGGTDERHAR
jgi:F0F1-type ATP synthase assembly protein I